ncbi:MAG: hypothetical protein VB112_00160 [Oscillospiraceae bacterium]|nr:hypothetical protein [Oscillospiraceae bacterium]
MEKTHRSKKFLAGLICTVVGAAALAATAVFMSGFKYAEPINSTQAALTPSLKFSMMLGNISLLHLWPLIIAFAALLIVGIFLMAREKGKNIAA